MVSGVLSIKVRVSIFVSFGRVFLVHEWMGDGGDYFSSKSVSHKLGGKGCSGTFMEAEDVMITPFSEKSEKNTG